MKDLGYRKGIVVYGLGNIITKGLAFLMIPLYARVLPIEAYGELELLTVVLSILILATDLGISSALMRYYHTENKEVVFSTAFWARVLSVSSLLLLLSLSNRMSFGISAGPQYLGKLVKLVILIAMMDSISDMPLVLFRITNKSFTYMSLILAKLIVFLVFAIYFVAIKGLGVIGVIYAMLSASSINVLFCLWSVRKHVKFRLSPEILKSFLKFGLPLVPSSFLISVIALSDRFFLRHFSNLTELGLYSMGYRFGSSVNIIFVAPLMLLWFPYLYSIENHPDVKERIAKAVNLFVGLVFFFLLALLLFLREVLPFLVTDKYLSSYNVVGIIGLGYFFYGMYYMVSAGIYYKSKTTTLIYINSFSAIVNLLLNLILVPKYGMMGAAIALLSSYFILAFTTYIAANGLFSVNYNWQKIFSVFLILVVMIILSQIPISYKAWLAVTLKLALCLIFLFTLFRLQMIPKEEIKTAKQFVKELLLKFAS